MLANTKTVAPKYQRYRNTRRATTHECQTNSSESLPAQKNDGYKTQNIARYRRTRGSFENAESQYAPPMPAEARVPVEKATAVPELATHALKPAPVMYESTEARRPWEVKPHKRNMTATRSESTVKSGEDGPTPPQLDAQQIADQLALQKLKDLMRLQAELDAAPPTPNFPLSPSPKKEKLIGLFSRRKHSKTSPPCTPYTPTSSMTKTSPESQRSQGLDTVNSTPQVDAPLSAVNAKERRVLIRFRESSINLPVTVDTKPADIIQAAANMMSQNVMPPSATLLESYSNLGLERRIRRYECIRDVMNSWDRDTQNALLLEHTTSDKELDANPTRVEAPPEITFHLYHSQKAGKWNKRYVTLLPSGQIFIAKKLGAKSTDKDYANICHLSDFDIYTVSSPHHWASLSPPKEICYAVKSQQKTTMFLSAENFVHYFSTEDKSTGDKFHSAVQQWRSWFVINRKGDGYQGFKDIKAMATGSASYGINSAKSPGEEISVGPASFQPLLQMNSSDVRDAEDEYHSRHEDSHDRPLQASLHQRNPRRYPPISYKAPPPPPPTETDAEFLSSSLLGRSYSERKREQEASASIRSSAGLKRAGSCPTNSDGPMDPAYKGPNQRSLLDFTPIFKGPPQWDRRGKGQAIRPVDGAPLIEAATSPALAGDDIPRFNSMLRREDAKSIREKCRTTAASEGPFVKGGLISGGDGGAAKRVASLKRRV